MLLCSCFCTRSAEGWWHPDPPRVPQHLLIWSGLHLQAAVLLGGAAAAAVWGFGVQGWHLLLGRNKLYDCKQELWQQDPRVRDSFIHLATTDGCVTHTPTVNSSRHLQLTKTSISSYYRAAKLDFESESTGNSHQSLLEGSSAQPQSNEGWFTFWN